MIKELENKYKIDLIKLKELLISIIYFIETFNRIKQIQMTDLIKELKLLYDSLKSNQINEEYIKNTINLLLKSGYDITKESTLIQFFEIFLGKEEALLFLKKINDSNFDIKNLYELSGDEEEFNIADIDNLIYVYNFFKNLIDNQGIKTDIDLLLVFQKKFYHENDIIIKIKSYLYTYVEFIQLYQAYYECPDTKIEIINQLLKESIVNIYKQKKYDEFVYKIEYKIQNGQNREIDFKELEELKNIILISFSKISKVKK